MKKAQYYRSCKDRKITAKAVKDTATTVAHRGTSGQTDSPLAEPFLNRLYNLTLPTMEEVLSSIPDYQGNALKSVWRKRFSLRADLFARLKRFSRWPQKDSGCHSLHLRLGLM